MTETLSDAPPPPPSPPPPRRLARDPDEAVVGGVCAAFGRYTDTDPVLWRVTVAVLALFGGVGVVLYGLAWLLVPRVDQPESALERTLRGDGRGTPARTLLVVVLAAVALLVVLDDGPGVLALAVVGGVAYLVARERRSGTPPTAAPYASAPDYAAPDYAAPDYAAPAYVPPAYAPPPAVVRRERSRLGGLTVSTATLVVGVLVALAVAGVDGITAPRVVAAALLVVGAGLVVGTWWGRARWLVAVAAVLALLLGATAGAQSAGLDRGVGERTWVATGADDASYRLGAGEAVLDLEALQPGRPVDLRARVGLGQLVVLVPEDLAVRVVADVGLGEIVEVALDGTRTDRSGGDGTDLHEEFVVGPPDDAAVELDLEVGVGEIEVRRVAA